MTPVPQAEEQPLQEKREVQKKKKKTQVEILNYLGKRCSRFLEKQMNQKRKQLLTSID